VGTAYNAPLREMRFVLRELAGLARVQALPGFEDAGDDTVDAVLEECAKLMGEVVAPLNRTGDVKPSTWSDGNVATTPGYREAFRAFVDGGWQGVMHPGEFGGQGLPKLVAAPCLEMLQSANLAFALCPLLTDGAIEAFLVAGSPEQQSRYVRPLIEGRWTGTMNLTEPQAGSDLALVRTRAERRPDGSFRLFGQKIFITFGDHDLAENIVHLVLGRLTDAPQGVKGLSLFAVPKYLVQPDGSRGARNDVYCASLEHKLGIKGSPTAVLIYGDDRGAVGPGAVAELVGAENRGLEAMFIMMNAARFQVGMQGIAVAERAYQQALSFARERIQGRAVEGSPGPVAIIEHPDVRRMLMHMRSHTEAARATAYFAAACSDLAHLHPDATERARNQALYEFLVPIVKGWSTEMAWATSRKRAPRSTTATRASCRSTRAPPRSRPTTCSGERPCATAAPSRARSRPRSRRPPASCAPAVTASWPPSPGGCNPPSALSSSRSSISWRATPRTCARPTPARCRTSSSAASSWAAGNWRGRR
jgi:3-(methylthio)propanoyl-CoA dehydrogenase